MVTWNLSAFSWRTLCTLYKFMISRYRPHDGGKSLAAYQELHKSGLRELRVVTTGQTQKYSLREVLLME